MKNESVACVGFGLGGHHEDYFTANGSRHLSGYDSPENWKPDEGVDYSKAVVINKRPAVEVNPMLAYRSPILRVSATSVEKLDLDAVSSVLVEAIAGQSTMVATCLSIHDATPPEEPGPFDNVGVAIYAAWWEANGARVGIVNEHGRIVWNDGEIQPRLLNCHEMAARLGMEIETYYSWGDKIRLKRDAEVIREGISTYIIQDVLAELGAPRFDTAA